MAETTPWHERAEELAEKEGPYADFAAWLEWAQEHESDVMIDELDVHTQLLMWRLCCEAVREKPQ